MGAADIVITPPCFNDPPCHRQASEHVLVEAFIAKAAIEALDKSVLNRLARGDVVPADNAFLLPAQNGMRGQLGAVVADYYQRFLAGCDDGIELACHPAAGDRRVDDQRQALTGEVVDNHEHPEAATIGQYVRDKVEAPTPVGTLRQGHWRACAEGPFAAAAVPNRQPLFPVDPEQFLVVQLDALTPQQDA